MEQITEIRDFNAPELDVYARFTEVQLKNREHPEQGVFIAESPKVIGRALDSGCEPLSFLVEQRHILGEAAPILERCPHVPVFTGNFELLTQLTGYGLTRGMLCAMRRPKLPEPEAVCRHAARIAILENVENPTNVGAIFRSAAALHMDGVLLTPGCSDPLYRRAARVSMGTVFQVPWTWIADWPQGGMEKLRAWGFSTAALALSPRAVSIRDPELNRQEKLAVLLGAEGDGLCRETLAQCDFTAIIPMSHGVDSLNVAAASAVAFYQLGSR